MRGRGRISFLLSLVKRADDMDGVKVNREGQKRRRREGNETEGSGKSDEVFGWEKLKRFDCFLRSLSLSPLPSPPPPLFLPPFHFLIHGMTESVLLTPSSQELALLFPCRIGILKSSPLSRKEREQWKIPCPIL